MLLSQVRTREFDQIISLPEKIVIETKLFSTSLPWSLALIFCLPIFVNNDNKNSYKKFINFEIQNQQKSFPTLPVGSWVLCSF